MTDKLAAAEQHIAELEAEVSMEREAHISCYHVHLAEAEQRIKELETTRSELEAVCADFFKVIEPDGRVDAAQRMGAALIRVKELEAERDRHKTLREEAERQVEEAIGETVAVATRLAAAERVVEAARRLDAGANPSLTALLAAYDTLQAAR